MNSSNFLTWLRSYYLYLAILIVLITVSTACQIARASIPASTATPFSLAEMEWLRNQQKWQSAGVSHYRFRLFRGCICEGNEDVLIEVKKEQVVSLKYQSGGAMEEYDRTYFESLGTIEHLFSIVEKEINGEPLILKVSYDPVYGFPTQVLSDPTGITDDELDLTISDFEVLP